MKSFFKIVFGSMLGFILTPLAILVLVVIFGSLISFFKSNDSGTPENAILHLQLNNAIPDRGNDNPLENFDINSFEATPSIGLNEILNDLQAAKTDNNIKGVFLDLSNTPSQFASIEEIRNQLLDFKQSGKFVYAFGDYYSQTAYYIATAADSVFLNPKGIIEFKGLHSSVAFFKDALNKLGIDVQVIRHGKFKGAVEPFMKNSMSTENRTQIETYINSIWQHLVNNIAKQRNIPAEQVNEYADNLSLSNAKTALANKMVDGLIYRDELLELLKNKTSQSSIKDVKLVSLTSYESKTADFNSNKIAVIYAEGEITGGKTGQDNIGSEDFIKTVRKARLNGAVKAIVIRVNSPGGSALASEIMWREIELAKQQKPVIVSMGNLAASGGYYMSCNANTIVASPTTITGSIGVFGILPNAKKLITDKLGVNVEAVNSNKHSDIAMPYRPLDEFEKNKIQTEVDNIYDDFVTRVADGRKMDKTKVDEIAQGRVWSAIDAKRIGLVDTLGGLQTAINIAAEQVNLTDYAILELPKAKSTAEMIIESLGGDVKSKIIESELDETYTYYKQLKNVIKLKGVQAKMEYDLIIN